MEVKTEIVGPFIAPEYSYVTIDGVKIPYIKLVPGKDENDGKLEIYLDNRFVYILEDTGDRDTWLNLLANAMAIAAGYSCFGENGVKNPNPFNVRMEKLGQ